MKKTTRPKYMDFFKLRNSISESIKEEPSVKKRFKDMRSASLNTITGMSLNLGQNSSTLREVEVGKIKTERSRGNSNHLSQNTRSAWKSSHHTMHSATTFQLPDMNDPKFFNMDSDLNKLNSKLRTNPRMPRVKGEIINVKVDIENQGNKSKKKPNAMNTESVLFKNAKKPKRMKKYEWKIHQKKKMNSYKRTMQRRRN